MLYRAVPDPSGRKGRFSSLRLTPGAFPLAEGIVQWMGKPFRVERHFAASSDTVGTPPRITAITEAVHGLIADGNSPDLLIAVRLFESSLSGTKYLLLNELASPEGEINFGYLIFRVRPDDLQIRDYDPLEAHGLASSRAAFRTYGQDLDLTRLVLDLFARIAREVYGKRRLVNTYPYPQEAERFLTAGFREITAGQDTLWVREMDS